jgi:AraC family transcriptional regulator, L-rhamnose operon regulatory protein RhaS
MNNIFQLESHLLYPHLKFAYIDGEHDVEFPIHCHDFSELFIVLDGSGIHQVSEFSYPLTAGDVFVINGQVAHGFQNVNDLKLVNLMFDHSTPLFGAPQLNLLPGYQALFKIEPIARQQSDYTARLHLTDTQFTQTLSLLEQLKTEYHHAPSGFEIMIQSLLRQLVITLSRWYQGDDSLAHHSAMSLSRALVYIEQNLQDETVKIQDIANASFISTRQLERLFSRYFQQSPNRFLRTKRLRLAKQLLIQNRTQSIQSIADQSGFSHSNYFSKCFTAEFKLTPKAYRDSGIYDL